MSLRVLIVEDEMTIALMLEDMLIELGHQVVGLAMRLPEALNLGADLELDFAILDVNLAGQMSFPVAELLRKRKIPFAFATGYGRSGIEAQFASVPVISKPFLMSDIATLVCCV